MSDKCKSCLRLREANKFKVPEIIIPVDDSDGFKWCRKCYQDERKKFDELKEAYGYRLYIDVCHGMKRTPLSFADWKEWREEKMSIETKCITVTKYGEKIRFQLDVNLVEDTKIMTFGLHTHKVCGGYIDKRRVSPSHYAFKCRACGLRIIIPIEIDTYKKLKEYAKILGQNWRM